MISLFDKLTIQMIQTIQPSSNYKENSDKTKYHAVGTMIKYNQVNHAKFTVANNKI